MPRITLAAIIAVDAGRAVRACGQATAVPGVSRRGSRSPACGPRADRRRTASASDARADCRFRHPSTARAVRRASTGEGHHDRQHGDGGVQQSGHRVGAVLFRRVAIASGLSQSVRTRCRARCSKLSADRRWPHRHQLQLIRLGRRLLLVSVTPDHAETLTEITDPDEVNHLTSLCRQQQPGSISDSFRQVLHQLGHRPAHGAPGGRRPRRTGLAPSGSRHRG